MQFGRYILEDDELGAGGFAVVYRAHDPMLNRTVAVKVLRPVLMVDPQFEARFRQEAQVAANLEHPHVVPVYDYGEDHGRLYIVMGYMPNGSLADLLKADALGWSESVLILQQLAGALSYAHARGLIHRDIKPANVLFDQEKRARLSDFGLVKALESTSASISVSGGILGTPAYIAPELWNNSQPSVQSDLYALACVVAEMVTGNKLFDADTAPAVMAMHFRPPPLPAAWPDGVPPGLTDVLRKALAREPGERYATVADFVAALTALKLDPLGEPYAALEAAIAAERWPDALALAERIMRAAPAYRDVTALHYRATQEVAAAQQQAWAAQWRRQAEAALAAGDLATAQAALAHWQKVAPDDAGAAEFAGRLAATPVSAAGNGDEAPPPEPPVTAANRGGRAWYWLPLLLLVPLVVWGAVALQGRQLEGTPTQQGAIAVVTEMPTDTPTVRPSNTPTPRPTNTPTPQPTNTPTSPPTATATNGTPEAVTMTPPAVRTMTLPDSQTEVQQVFVPAGPFTMGSNDGFDDERPAREVTLDAFWIDQTEVTNAQFAAFVAATGYETTAEQAGWGYVFNGSSWEQTNGANWEAPQGAGSRAGADHPVVQVSWHDATAYCGWRGAALPTEAQWEKAARGTDGRTYPWGEQIDGTRLNYCDANCEFDWKDSAVDDGYTDTAPVGSYPTGASPYGALDMAGNVWEWVADWYDGGYYANAPDTNPNGPQSGTARVLRGGSWNFIANFVRAASRYDYDPANRYSFVGFRCAQEEALP